MIVVLQLVKKVQTESILKHLVMLQLSERSFSFSKVIIFLNLFYFFFFFKINQKSCFFVVEHVLHFLSFAYLEWVYLEKALLQMNVRELTYPVQWLNLRQMNVLEAL